jgi:hypothetical protein
VESLIVVAVFVGERGARDTSRKMQDWLARVLGSHRFYCGSAARRRGIIFFNFTFAAIQWRQ